MRKEYSSPEFELLSLQMNEIMVASQYSATPEDPGVGGNDDYDGQL